MSSFGRSHEGRSGFSLLELLVVLGIITFVIAILLPMVAHVRESARATKCLANVQQWGYAYQMYVNSYRGRSVTAAGVGIRGQPVVVTPWWELLLPYIGNARGALFCPAAREVRSDPPDPGPHMVAVVRGSAVLAWVYRTSQFHASGSYGFNSAINELPSSPHEPGSFTFFFDHLPVRDSSRIPVVSECVYPTVNLPIGTEGPSQNLDDPGPCNGVTECCIDRHQRSVNIAFVDGHAERVQLTQLWKLKWSPDFRESNVYIP